MAEELRSVPDYEYFGKGITVTAGFDLNGQAPLDHRTVSKSIDDLLLMEDIKKYEGLKVRVKGVGTFEYVPFAGDASSLPVAEQALVDGVTGYRWAKVYTQENIGEITDIMKDQIAELSKIVDTVEDVTVSILDNGDGTEPRYVAQFSTAHKPMDGKPVLIIVNTLTYVAKDVCTVEEKLFSWNGPFELEVDDTVKVSYTYDSSIN